MMNYVRFTETTQDVGRILPITEDLTKHIKNKEKDYYLSLFQYSDKHLPIIQNKNGSVSGITDVIGTKLYFDFDSKDNLEQARQDTITTGSRLIAANFPQDSVQIYFSGNKGFGLEVLLTQEITPEQFKAVVFHYASDLETFDKSIHNASRIIRLPNTKHNVSGLYKIELTEDELFNLPIDDIKTLALSTRNLNLPHKLATIPSQVLNTAFQDKGTPKPITVSSLQTIDWSKKPQWLTNCRYALQHGLFKNGTTSHLFLVMGSTYRNQGFSKEITLAMLSDIAEAQNEFDNSGDAWTKSQLDRHIISQVFGPNWNGGQGSCKELGTPLNDYCKALGEYGCLHINSEEKSTVQADDIFNYFTQYAKDYDKNVLKTGVVGLDDHLRLLVGTSNGILAAPGCGKTSIALQILKHNSQQDVPCLFFSYDMFYTAVYTRIVQNLFGYDQDKIYKLFRDGGPETAKIQAAIKKAYANVQFCFKAGQSPEEIRRTIRETQQKTGQAVKLVVVDYNELVISDRSDPTTASAEVAQKLREIANTERVCMLTLMQPSKLFANPADDFNTAQAAKGSGSIQQSLTTLLGCSRPGHNPQNMQNDKYFNITCLKNRNGGLFSLDFRWNGVKGEISPLMPGDSSVLGDLRESRKKEKAGVSDSWGKRNG